MLATAVTAAANEPRTALEGLIRFQEEVMEAEIESGTQSQKPIVITSSFAPLLLRSTCGLVSLPSENEVAMLVQVCC